MITKDYTIVINTTADRVWYVLWDDAHYRQWTAAFTQGSYAVTDNWKEGSRVHFLSPDGRGMYSNVSENIAREKMVFTHIGEIKNFEEQPLTEETKVWTGGKESYRLDEKDGITTLIVSVDTVENFGDYFDKSFPLALAYIKELAENFHIIVSTTVNAEAAAVWHKWTNPADIIAWNNANAEWHTPKASNDLRTGGRFNYRMEAKDGSMGFDFEGAYSNVVPNELIEYTVIDGRKVIVQFKQEGKLTRITEKFQPESMNPFEMQRDGWQAILDNFKGHAEH